MLSCNLENQGSCASCGGTRNVNLPFDRVRVRVDSEIESGY